MNRFGFKALAGATLAFAMAAGTQSAMAEEGLFAVAPLSSEAMLAQRGLGPDALSKSEVNIEDNKVSTRGGRYLNRNNGFSSARGIMVNAQNNGHNNSFTFQTTVNITFTP